MTPPIVNLADLTPQPRPPEYTPPPAIAARIDAHMVRIGPLLGLKGLGCSLIAVAPGKQAFPFHSHRHADELFVVLAGRGELRYGSGRHALREGDVIGCPPGAADTAHAITNTGTTELRYLAISTQPTLEVCDYPDSGKFALYDEAAPTAAGGAPQFWRFVGRDGQHLDYWDGE